MTSRATPTAKNPTHAITLSDGTYTYGFELADLPQRAIQDNTATPSTLVVTGGGNKYGNGDPSFSHIEQRDWTGGRGQEDFQDDATRFYDNNNCWTGTPNLLMPSMEWRFSKGIYDALENTPTDKGKMEWVGLYGARRYYSVKFTNSYSGTFTGTRLTLWARKHGTPGDAQIYFYSDSSGSPGSSLIPATENLEEEDFEENISRVVELAGGYAFTAGSSYHVVIVAAATDDADNCWEIGCDNNQYSVGEVNKKSSDGTTWAADNYYKMYYRIKGGEHRRDFLDFDMYGLKYVVSKYFDETTASDVYMNGQRGMVVAAGASNFTAGSPIGDQHGVGGYVYIISGKGEGQSRQIIGHAINAVPPSSYTYTYAVDQPWDTVPDTTSQYIITGVDVWQKLTTTGITKPVKSVCTAGNDLTTLVTYFAQGSATNIRKMHFSTSTGLHEYKDDGTNKADMLYTWHTDGKTKIVRVLNKIEVSFADLPSNEWSGSLSFGTAIKVGVTDHPVNNIIDYNGTLWVAKADSLWFYDAAIKQFKRLNAGLDAAPSYTTGKGFVSQNLYLYFSWSSSIERLYGGNAYGGTLDDIGLWKGSGLPKIRKGRVVSLTPVYSWLFAGVDAGTSDFKESYSSVMMYNGIGWFEVFRSWDDGKRVLNTFWHAVPDGRSRLWISCGGELISIVFPIGTLNPSQDEGEEFVGDEAVYYVCPYTFNYQAILDTSTFDFGMASQPKYIHKLTVITENLGSGRNIFVYYQADSDVGSDDWTYAGTLTTSPEDSVDLKLGNKRKIRLRYILHTTDTKIAPLIRATVLEGFVRTPHKRVWVVRTKTSPFQVTRMGTPDTKPSVLYDWLNEKIDQADKLTMEAIYDSMHNHSVIMDQYRLVPKSHDEIEGEDSYELWMTLREA